ncbi:MAG: hypothetical protein ABIV51_12510 [Saprospiraceae bacterium]
MKPLYNYKPYPSPKIGIFSVDTNKYQFPEGWVQRHERAVIIGEDDSCFVHRLKKSGHGEWVGEKVIKYKYILPIGYHKTRLVRWETGQLELQLPIKQTL